jgi:hypothetical protein
MMRSKWRVRRIVMPAMKIGSLHATWESDFQ